ncbi:CGNR zinc finger domain-containing protein [Roseospirillum parvum]|uniref:Conserved protein containing a Zn-ribbon-like motif, possibly RNA-binding n=1 Tax=Roseospirillum parvum TaxID=83401 RepID=A0A1G7V3P4_9PROT|nr:CGNR zinc finger domain-containing protein [Roseospirillum parvum]SDG54347.1 Conserved protein containing a Zn-ribbon-like motif, possibly RNA-binding [Roseospirillum parvum]
MAYTWETHGPFGGHVVLDFVNTVDDALKTRELNAIPDWPTFLDWSLRVGLASGEEAALLAGLGDAQAQAAELAELWALREALYGDLTGLLEEVPGRGLSSLGAAARWGLGLAVLAPAPSTAPGWQVGVDTAGLATPRARLGVAVEDLLWRGDLARLRQCGRCTGLYLDHGRGAGRRWCRMETCGNRAKAERHRARRGE